MRDLTEKENKVMELLGDAWNAFMDLDHTTLNNQHGDQTDFIHHLKACQRIVMSRPQIEVELAKGKKK